MIRIAIAFVVSAALLHAADTPVDPGPTEAVQKLFDSMAARNADAARSVFAPDAAIFSLGANGKAVKMPLEDFLTVLGSDKKEWRERMWDIQVLVHNEIAVVWGPYDFHLDGAFTHCGFDSFGLVRTAAGWKITYISDTRETKGCVNPIGPPK